MENVLPPGVLKSTAAVQNVVVENVARVESGMYETFALFWNFALFEVEGSPITLGKVLIGLALAVAGYFFASLASRYLGRRVIRRLEIPGAMQYTLERLVFYLLYIFCVLFVLQLLSIPITIFTVIGGALAIGLGFGSQNVVNNFISGLIVMVEQPVRVGDWVQIEGAFGRVEEIGSRSTYIRTLENKQTVIPNSFFLEKMLVNWTLGDNLVNGKVAVGVAYESDPRKVKSLLLEVAQKHPDVLKVPAPTVLFVDFAESSLNFELGFSIEFSEATTVGRVSSDLRFLIAEAFQAQGVQVPFPHRELILRQQKPLSIEVQSRNSL